MTTQHRQPAGTPSGGQFAAGAKAESNVGLAPEQDPLSAYRTLGFTSDNAVEWQKHGIAPNSALAWAVAAIGPSEAAEWTALGVTDPNVARRWGYAGPGTVTASRARPWIEAGFGNDDIDMADDWGKRGFTGEQAGRWLTAGFGKDEAGEAEAWHKARYFSRDAAELRAEGFTPDKLSPTLFRTGETAFQVAQGTRGHGALYTVRAVPSEQYAADHGCPGATHMLVGAHETRFGRLEALGPHDTPTGRLDALGALRRRNVPGWSAERKGVKANFVCDQDPDWEPLCGYVGE